VPLQGQFDRHDHPPLLLVHDKLLPIGVYWPVSLLSRKAIISNEQGKPAMNIEIHDAALEARIKKQLQATGSASVEEVLLRLLETQEEQDRWLAENREAINAKIRRGIDQLDRGQGIPEDQLDSYLADLKAKPE
jgi:post-segregation antitoxin (ccd killing protein)